jgi:tetratricopeptide (TPR) repeat protein
MATRPDSNARRGLDTARLLLSRGRVAEARGLAEGAIAARPRDADAHRILGLCLREAGESEAAVAAFRAGLKLDKGDAEAAVALAGLLNAAGRAAEAERVLRAALEANRRSGLLMSQLSRQLTAMGRAEEALRVTAKLVAEQAPEHEVLAAHGAALKAAGQQDRALAIHARATTLYPDSPIAYHNLAANQGDLGQFAASEKSAARALAKGGTAPQTWLVYARALLGGNRLDEAERAFRETIRRDPASIDAHRDLAQLIWMRTEDAGAAIASLDTAIGAYPQLSALFTVRANVLRHAGALDAARATLGHAIRLHPGQARLHMAAAEIAALQGQASEALLHAEKAASLLPGDDGAQSALFAACVACGDAERGEAIAAGLVARRPLDQRALAYQATAWRLTGDPRYAALYDYAAFARAWRMDVPDGWATLEAYLSDLTEALGGLHPFRTHPLDQSLRHGSQAMHLLASDNAVVRAFFQAVDGPIRAHLEAMGHGRDPLRARNTGGFRFHGAWSVRLRPGGFHTDHIHPEGWLSSACYIALPEVETAGREAWIKFGEPGIPTSPALGPEHFVKPEPGMLVLFPSYMWHGTVPFASGGTRLSVAFDLLPA